MARPPEHLKKRAEFLKIARAGQRVPTTGFILQALPRGDRGSARVGMTLTRKVGNAVVRNRARRRLREVARLVLAERLQSRPEESRENTPASGTDLVLIGRRATATLPFPTLLGDFRRALDRVGLR